MKANNREEYEVTGDGLLNKVKEIIKKGNANRIIIKNEKGDEIMSVPLTLGVVGAVFAPALAAIGTVAALVSKCTIVVEKKS